MDWDEFEGLRRSGAAAGTGRRSKWADFVRELKVGEPTKVPTRLSEDTEHPDDKQKANAIHQVKIHARRQARGEVWFVEKDGDLWCAIPPEAPQPPPKPSADEAAVLYCRETGCRGTYVNGVCTDCNKRMGR